MDRRRRGLHRPRLPHQDPPGAPRRARLRARLPRRRADDRAQADRCTSSPAAPMVLSAGWWVAIVELVPAARPYIGGSQDNSFLELTFGYNGLGRLSGDETGSVGGGGGAAATACGARPGCPDVQLRDRRPDLLAHPDRADPAGRRAGLRGRRRAPTSAARPTWSGAAGSWSRCSSSRSWPASSTSTTRWRSPRPSPRWSAWAPRGVGAPRPAWSARSPSRPRPRRRGLVLHPALPHADCQPWLRGRRARGRSGGRARAPARRPRLHRAPCPSSLAAALVRRPRRPGGLRRPDRRPPATAVRS